MIALAARPCAVAFDPATELAAAALFCTLSDDVPPEARDRLDRAAAALPDVGLPLAWHELATLSRAYVRINRTTKRAPRAELARLISRAVDAGTPARFGWQERDQ